MIRIATEKDLPAILEIYRPYVERSTASFEYVTPSMEDFIRRFRMITEKYPWLVWEENGDVVGYAYGSAPFERAGYAWCAEPSIYVRSDHHGRGIGKKLYDALENLLFAMGYRVLYAIVTDENQGSLAFHRALGYTQVAHLKNCAWKFQKNLGIIYLEKRADFVDSPSENPAPWSEFVENAGKVADILDKITLS